MGWVETTLLVGSFVFSTLTFSFLVYLFSQTKPTNEKNRVSIKIPFSDLQKALKVAYNDDQSAYKKEKKNIPH